MAFGFDIADIRSHFFVMWKGRKKEDTKCISMDLVFFVTGKNKGRQPENQMISFSSMALYLASTKLLHQENAMDLT